MGPDELIERVVTSLVDHPEDVLVTVAQGDDDSEVVILLEVAPEDQGFIIGHSGIHAYALETLARTWCANGSDYSVRLEIVGERNGSSNSSGSG